VEVRNGNQRGIGKGSRIENLETKQKQEEEREAGRVAES
jgi:hypothetical protein